MSFLQILIPFIYAVAWVGFLFYFKTQEKLAFKLALGTLSLGFLVHSLYLSILSLDLFKTFSLTFNHTLFWFSWSLILVYLYLTFSKIKAYSLGTFFVPLPLFFFLLAVSLEPRQSSFLPVLKSFWFPVHALSALLSHAFLLLGLTSSLMYILVDRALKGKDFGYLFNRLPPLSSLARINERCLYQGFFFLSLGMTSGAVWSEVAYGDYWRWSPKEVLSLVLWLIYALMIHQRVLIGWRGRKLAYMFALGSGLFFLSFIIINLYVKGFHTYGG